MWLLDDAYEGHLPATAREVADVTGAGDTVIATLGLALAAGATSAKRPDSRTTPPAWSLAGSDRRPSDPRRCWGRSPEETAVRSRFRLRPARRQDPSGATRHTKITTNTKPHTTIEASSSPRARTRPASSPPASVTRVHVVPPLCAERARQAPSRTISATPRRTLARCRSAAPRLPAPPVPSYAAAPVYERCVPRFQASSSTMLRLCTARARPARAHAPVAHPEPYRASPADEPAGARGSA